MIFYFILHSDFDAAAFALETESYQGLFNLPPEVSLAV